MMSYTQLQATRKVTLCTCISMRPERKKKHHPLDQGENICLGHQEGMLTSSYMEAMIALGWNFFHRRGWVFLYLGQDVCAKICLMNKPQSLPPKPVAFHNHFLWTGKQCFCESSFVICLFFFFFCFVPFSFLLFHSRVT